MARPKKKHISGTGYTKFEASQLAYKRYNNRDKTYEIDTDAIDKVVKEYIDERTEKDDNTGKITEYKPMSEASLMQKLGIYKRETYRLWLNGYTNRDHIADDSYICNDALSEAIAQGDNAIAIYRHEYSDPKKGQLTIKQLETQGEIATKETGHTTISVNKLGKLSIYSK